MKFPTHGLVVEWLQFHPVTVRGTGSNPVGTAMSKRYSSSLVTFFKDVIVVAFHDFKEGVRRSMVVTKPPSMFDF